ncbi:hypothetical protein [Marinomonas sp. THO17]|uniref:hypothetical protein n=1 Tax=Marinomonas sp. THO17 TaxID=3149048 RepID=UPI00336BFC84
MKIQHPPFLYGQQGLQQTQRNLDQISKEVAQMSTQNFDRVQPKELDVQHGSLAETLTEARQVTRDAQSNAQVLDDANQNLGRIIDISV